MLYPLSYRRLVPAQDLHLTLPVFHGTCFLEGIWRVQSSKAFPIIVTLIGSPPAEGFPLISRITLSECALGEIRTPDPRLRKPMLFL